VEFRISDDIAQNIDVTSDHPLLWTVAADSVAAYFNGAPADSIAAVGALYEAHHGAAGNWIPFSRFFNPLPLSKLLAAGNGKLAEGPAPLLEIYRGVLGTFGVDVQLKFPRRPSRWMGATWVEFGPQKVLLMDESYVIATDFKSARRN
jgi:hypothetical protein